MTILNRDEQLNLVLQAMTGNQDAITTLYTATVPMLTRALTHLVSEADVDDMVQETLIKAFNRLDQFNGESLFTSWCVSIARNTAITLHRRESTANKYIVDSTDRMTTGSDGSIRKAIDVGYEDRTADQNLSYETVHAAMATLKPKYQTALAMSMDGASGEELAEALAQTVANATSTLVRAKAALKAAIEGTAVSEPVVVKKLYVCRCGCGTVLPGRGYPYVAGHKKAKAA